MIVVDALRRAITDAFPQHIRDRFALLVVTVAFLAGAHAFVNLQPASGIYLEAADGRLVVAGVAEWSTAYRQGIEPGMVAVAINGQQVISMPLDGIEKTDPADLWWLLEGGGWISGVDAIAAEDVAAYEAGTFDGPIFQYWTDAGRALDNSGSAVILGLLILAVAGWYIGSGRAGAGIQPLAIPIAVAASTPLLLVPLDLVEPIGRLPTTLLLMLAILPLADGASALIDDPATRRDVRLAVLAIATAAIVISWWGSATGSPAVTFWRLLAVAAIPLLPAAVAARPRASALSQAGSSSSRRVAEASELLLVAVTPAIATLTMTFPSYEPVLWPILLWLAALLAAARFTVRPLLRLATRAQLQRDLVVAASEAERARLAADLHDDALQDLTLLVRRLDAAGDTESAAQARAVADRLRDICGDLRLPILDDLGVGPALDWLVLRIERMAGGEVRLERTDGSRPPADIELAVFRVAQEALANAVKHGRPPIVVRYRATDTGVSLSIDDAGPGIDAEAREAATTGGHFGLLNMQQRAEAIGALLDVRQWPGGGTHVALEWRAG